MLHILVLYKDCYMCVSYNPSLSLSPTQQLWIIWYVLFFFQKYLSIMFIMACHILYGRPYCNDAKEGFGGITPPKLNRGGWNSARTKYFEGNVVCKNLGTIGSGAAEGHRKTSLGDPKKLGTFFLWTQPRTISPTSRRPIFTKFSLEHVDRCPAKSFRSWILKFFR